MSRGDDWNQRYVEGRTGWDLGEPPPALLRAAKARSAHLEGAGGPLSVPTSAQRVLVPGAGRAHDARGWARFGFRVTAVDLAALALEQAAELARGEGVELELVRADVTDLPAEWTERFDFVWEQTCLCALPVELRAPYLKEVARVLKPGGELLALLWNHGNEGGPPYDMNPQLVGELLSHQFELGQAQDVPDSPAGRTGERLFHARKR